MVTKLTQDLDPISAYFSESPFLASLPIVVGHFWGGVGVQGPTIEGEELVERMRNVHPLLLDLLAPEIIVGLGGVGDMVMFPEGDSNLLSNMVVLIYTVSWVIEHTPVQEICV